MCLSGVDSSKKPFDLQNHNCSLQEIFPHKLSLQATIKGMGHKSFFVVRILCFCSESLMIPLLPGLRI